MRATCQPMTTRTVFGLVVPSKLAHLTADSSSVLGLYEPLTKSTRTINNGVLGYEALYR